MKKGYQTREFYAGTIPMAIGLFGLCFFRFHPCYPVGMGLLSFAYAWSRSLFKKDRPGFPGHPRETEFILFVVTDILLGAALVPNMPALHWFIIGAVLNHVGFIIGRGQSKNIIPKPQQIVLG